MTTLTITQFGSSSFGNAGFVSPRAPRRSFAARLAALQAKHEPSFTLSDAAGVVARGAAASVPFVALAWMFVAI